MSTTIKQPSNQKTFNNAFPFDISIQNQYQGELLPRLYIANDHDDQVNEKLKELVINIKPRGNKQFKFGGYDITKKPKSSNIPIVPADAPFQPGPEQFNFAIAWRPGILNETIIPNLASMLQFTLQNAIGKQNQCYVSGPFTRISDHAQVWYCAFQHDMDIPEGLNFKLQDITANPAGGSRNTQVEFIFGNVFVNENNHPLTYKQSLHLEIVNHKGNAPAPLHFAVWQDNMLLNNASNDLTIYFESIGRIPIQFGPDTKFTFSFSYYTGKNADRMSFGSKDKVYEIQWGRLHFVPVVPYNERLKNQFFKDQFKTTTTDPIAKDDGNGNMIFSRIFQSTIKIDNDKYDHIKSLITQYEKAADKSKQYYLGTRGPNKRIEKLKVSYLKKIDWSREEIDQEFYNTLTDLNQRYYNNFIHSPNSPQGTQNLLSFFINNALDLDGYPITTNIDSFIDTVTLDINKPFNINTWETNTNNIYYTYTSGGNSVIKFNSNNLGAYINRAYFADGPNHNGDPSYWPVTIFNKRSRPNPWTDQNFIHFLSNNFKNIITNLAESYKNQADFFMGTGTKVLPCKVLYDYLRDVYSRYINYILNNYLSSFLLDTSNGFTKKQWQTSLLHSKAEFANLSPEALTTDNVEIPAAFDSDDHWYDPEYYHFVQNHLIQITEGLLIEGTYCIPSASLYSYFYAHYQASKYSLVLSNVPQKKAFYINPTTCFFNFSNVLLSGLDGQVILHIRVENLADYWDTDFQLPITKSSSKLDANLYMPKGSATIGKDLLVNGKVKVNNDLTISGKGIFERESIVKANLNVTHGFLSNTYNTQTPPDPSPRGACGLSVGWNKSGGEAEVNFYNTYKPGPTNAFRFSKHEKTGWKDLMTITGQGRIHDKTGDVMPVGSIIAFGGSTVPNGWLLCDGRAITKEEYPDLHKAVGDHVPDLRSRFIVGSGKGEGLKNYGAKDKGGEEQHTLTEREMPGHNHSVNQDGNHYHMHAVSQIPMSSTNVSSNKADSGDDVGLWLSGQDHRTTSGGWHTHTINNTGGSQPHNNLPPYYALKYIIKC